MNEHLKTIVRQCTSLETTYIYIENVSIKTRFRVIDNCCTLTCFERFDVMLHLSKEPHSVPNKRHLMFCESTIEVEYDIHKIYDKNKYTNIIIIPNNAIHVWNSYIHERNESNVQMIDNASKLTDMHLFKVNVVPASFWTLVSNHLNSNHIQVGRLLVDSLESIQRIANNAGVLFAFVWVFVNTYADLENICIKSKGFIKNIIIELRKHFPIKLLSYLVYSLPKYLLLDRNNIITHSFVDTDCEVYELEICSMDKAVNVLTKNKTDKLKHIDSKLDVLTSESNNVDMRIERLRHDKLMLEQQINSEKERICQQNQCGICLDDLRHRTILKCCSNSFCFRCIRKWTHIKEVCPLCKQSLIENMQILIYDISHTESLSLSSNNLLFENIMILLDLLHGENVVIYTKTLSKMFKHFITNRDNVCVINNDNVFICMNPCNHLILLDELHPDAEYYLLHALTPNHIWRRMKKKIE